MVPELSGLDRGDDAMSLELFTSSTCKSFMELEEKRSMEVLAEE